jgi:signal transduction histidine kinase
MRKKARGTLSVLNKSAGGEYDVQDIIVLETLASQAAIALENARLMKETRAAYSRLDELDEMKNNFIAISSHELRIPLGLILGHATYLKETLQREEKEQVDVIERSAIRLKDILEDLSQIENLKSDTDALRSASCDLSALFKKILAEHRMDSEEKGLKLVSKLPEESVNIFGEANKLRIAFNHLLKNAIAFTDQGGSVEISLTQKGKNAEIFVSDTGIGISKKDLGEIFNRFFQVEGHMTRLHGGMGLGLTVAKAIIDIHKGEITVESVEGMGTRFHVSLPLTLAE